MGGYLKVLTRYTVHGRGAKHWFTPSQIIKSTLIQILQFLDFFHPRNPRQKPFFKVSKKFIKSSPKPDPKSWANPIDMNTLNTFFQFFSKPKKSIVQNTKVQRHVIPPHILFAKSNYFPDGRTNERTNIPVLTVRTDVKSASRNKQRLWGPMYRIKMKRVL